MEKITQVTADAAPEPATGNFSNCLKVGNLVFLSGMTASDPQADAYSQSYTCLEKIDALVRAAGGTISDIVKITVFLTDMEYRNDFSRARQEFFPGTKPCSSLIGIKSLAQAGLVVEVEAIAVIGAGD